MSIKFTFPKNPRVGDRVEVLCTSDTKLPVQLVGNPESGKNITLIFPNEIKEGIADGETPIASIEDKNIIYTFRCISVFSLHVWLLEVNHLSKEIFANKDATHDLANKINEATTKVSELESKIASLETELQNVQKILEEINGNAA